MAKAYGLLVILMHWGACVHGQALKDTIRLQESEVVGYKAVPVGQYIAGPGRAGLDWTVQPLSEISYKTYGLSGVGSLSYRGLPASQTPLLWHGISLSSPLLGQADINQTPISPEWAAYARGTGDGTLTAGSALPSAVALGHRTLLSDSGTHQLHTRTRLTLGTYASRQTETLVEGKWGAFSAYGRFWYQQAANDFAIYRVASSDPLLPTRQSNAETRNSQQEYGLSYQASRTYRVSLDVLDNRSDRNLPPPITKYRSLENLKSALSAFNLRQILELDKLRYTSTVGFVRDFSRYRFENGMDVSPYATQNLQANGHLECALFAKVSLRVDHSHQWAKPIEGDYPARVLQAHAGVVTAAWKTGSLELLPALQLHGFAGKTYLFPALQVSWTQETMARIRWKVEARTAGLFRSPTLNDLYYPQSGNPDLRPEKGRVYEIRLQARQAVSGTSGWEIGLTPFLYQYASFIAWVPQGNLWAPRQRENAASSGITALVSYHTGSRVRSTARLQATWSRGGFGGTWITAQQRPEPFLYAPAARVTATVGAEWKALRCTYSASYTGARVIDSEAQVPPLSPFLLHCLVVEWAQITLPKGTFAVSVQGSLVDRPAYSFIANYAAPRYWGAVSVTYQIGYAR